MATSVGSILRMSPQSGIVVSGTPNHKIESVTLENIDITLPGGGTKKDSEIIMLENIAEYPEFTELGVSLVYGMFVRNVKN